jgi:hypothetical protein
MTSPSARLRLFRALEDVLGADAAATLLDSLPQPGPAGVATKDDVRLQVHGLRAELHALVAEIRADLAERDARLVTAADVHALEQRLAAHAAAHRRLVGWSAALHAGLLAAIAAAALLL